MTPARALLSASLAIVLAGCTAVLLRAAWAAHQRGLARVRAAEVRELLRGLPGQRAALERLQVRAAPQLHQRRAIPAGDLYPPLFDTRCEHGRRLLERCDHCAPVQRWYR